MNITAKNLSEWLNYLEQNCAQKSRGFDKFQRIVKTINLNKFTCPIITVGGTNGKGSSCNYITNILQSSGYKTACYTSPHLLEFNERIKINGKNCSDNKIINAFEKTATLIDIKKSTYFEFITLTALYIFQQHQIDILILEVGLGGRFDPVNALDADIAVITSIDLEHTERLGNNREQIAFEKCGIMRPNQFLICADQNPPLIINKIAKQLHINLIQIIADKDKITVEIAQKAIKLLQLHFNFIVHEDDITEGIKIGKPPGRFQILQTNPELIIDVAHNPAGAKFLAKQLMHDIKINKTIAIIGILQTKDVKNILKPFIDLIDDWYCIDLTPPKAIPSQNIANKLQSLGAINTHSSITAKEALETALRDAKKTDRIIVFGSFYTAAEIIKAYDEGKY